MLRMPKWDSKSPFRLALDDSLRPTFPPRSGTTATATAHKVRPLTQPKIPEVNILRSKHHTTKHTKDLKNGMEFDECRIGHKVRAEGPINNSFAPFVPFVVKQIGNANKLR